MPVLEPCTRGNIWHWASGTRGWSDLCDSETTEAVASSWNLSSWATKDRKAKFCTLLLGCSILSLWISKTMFRIFPQCINQKLWLPMGWFQLKRWKCLTIHAMYINKSVKQYIFHALEYKIKMIRCFMNGYRFHCSHHHHWLCLDGLKWTGMTSSVYKYHIPWYGMLWKL